MSKISDLNYSQHITLADNFKQKSEVLNTWRVGMNNFAQIAEGQDNTRNILDSKTFLEFLVKIFGNDSNLLIVFYVQIMPDDFVMQLHR
ncbi:hypothetical protein OSL00_02435, partial [Escherichia coli]|nr:hypothetical protein [Escherichia coli]